MCITIPSSANVKRARQWLLWQWLAASPLRLYPLGGGALLIIGLAIELAWSPVAPGWYQFNLCFALIPALLLGPAFEWIPGVLKVTPPTYLRYASLFLLLLLSQLLFHAGSLWTQTPGLLYLVPLGGVWGVSLFSLRGMLKFSYARNTALAVAVFYLLLSAGGAALLVAVGLLAGWLTAFHAYLWGAALALYLPLLVVLLLLHFVPGAAAHH